MSTELMSHNPSVSTKAHHSNTSNTNTFIDALFFTYSKIMKDRRAIGSTWTGMTRREYEEYRRPNDPHYRVIERTLGDWSSFTDIIGSRHQREKIDYSVVNKKHFHAILIHISIWLNKTSPDRPKRSVPWNITVKEYRQFQKEFPEYNVHDWRTYARAIIGVDSWTQLVSYVVADIARGTLEKRTKD